MEIREVALQIEKAIEAIKVEGQRSILLIKNEAESMQNYDKKLAIESIKHKDAGMSVTLIRDQAKGDASECLYAMIVAQRTMKAHWERLKYLQAQLNGLQSIYRHLDST